VRQLLNLDFDILLFGDGRRSSTTPGWLLRSAISDTMIALERIQEWLREQP
jgi:hypothetical protein